MSRGRNKHPAPEPGYPAGFFMALVQRHHFPPCFESRMGSIQDHPNKGRPSLHGGWGDGTVNMPGTPSSHGKPAWMMRAMAR